MPNILRTLLRQKSNKKPQKPKAPSLNFLQQAVNAEGNHIIVGEGLTAIGKNSLRFQVANSGNTIEIGRNVKIHKLKIVIKGQGARLVIGDNVRITGQILMVGKGRNIVIGNNTTMQGVYLLARDADITIGEHCMFSREIEVRTTDVHKLYDIETGLRINKAGNVTIGNRVWVAARAMISKGATVPDGCVIGAMSFVNKAFTQANTLYAGVPSRAIRSNVRWER